MFDSNPYDIRIDYLTQKQLIMRQSFEHNIRHQIVSAFMFPLLNIHSTIAGT